ncbi:hypothetical protein Athai_47140 [Actinocatenispora thailandica]|uniref:Condensation domain-containing protein n=2 Tax=Actinocatenispora thailandica TaxID=227318 RepID=A0A7R7DT01_9ACTN|nr:hypothetical protein [Actinocatenispora thailandica]BCJ37211.1 hypothetical protein Athai_47140 [Actinocatenispora thailandica]
MPHRAGFAFQLELRLPAGSTGEVVASYRCGEVDQAAVSGFVRTFTAFVTGAVDDPPPAGPK